MRSSYTARTRCSRVTSIAIISRYAFPSSSDLAKSVVTIIPLFSLSSFLTVFRAHANSRISLDRARERAVGGILFRESNDAQGERERERPVPRFNEIALFLTPRFLSFRRSFVQVYFLVCQAATGRYERARAFIYFSSLGSLRKIPEVMDVRAPPKSIASIRSVGSPPTFAYE